MTKIRILEELVKEIEKAKRGHIDFIDGYVDSYNVYNITLKRFQKIEKGYTISDIEVLANKILKDEKQDYWVGYVISALINQKIKLGDEIILKPEAELYSHSVKTRFGVQKQDKMRIRGLGYEFPAGKLIIEGNVKPGTCEHIHGGEVIINGNAEGKRAECETVESLGFGMDGGAIRLNGNTTQVGTYAKGGATMVEGETEGVSNRFLGGIIIKNGKMERFKPAPTDLPLDEKFPDSAAKDILIAHIQSEAKISALIKQGRGKKNKCAGWRGLVQNPQKYEALKYVARLRSLDQKLPAIIRKIGKPKRKLNALKTLEEEACNNPERGIIELAQKCGANTEQAERIHNQKIKEEIRKLRRELF